MYGSHQAILNNINIFLPIGMTLVTLTYERLLTFVFGNASYQFTVLHTTHDFTNESDI